MAEFVGCAACPWAPYACQAIHRSPVPRGRAAPPGQAIVGSSMAETSIFLAGNLTDDPELRYTTSRTARATFRVAVSGRVRDGDGWKDGEASFFTVVVWRDQAEHAAGSLAKGSWVVVVGRLAQRSWQAFESEDCSRSVSTAARQPPLLATGCSGP
jgi:hypothetical protein